MQGPGIPPLYNSGLLSMATGSSSSQAPESPSQASPNLHPHLTSGRNLEIVWSKSHLVMRMIEMRIGQEPLLQVGEVSWPNFRRLGNHNMKKLLSTFGTFTAGFTATCASVRVLYWPQTNLGLLGSFRSDGSENVTQTVNSRCFRLLHSYSISSNVSEFFLELNSKRLYLSSFFSCSRPFEILRLGSLTSPLSFF